MSTSKSATSGGHWIATALACGALALGGCIATTTKSAVGQAQFTITTGGDDLRNDSSASANIHFQDGSSQSVTLKSKDEAAWPNGSMQTRAVDLFSASPITGVDISIGENPSFLESDDQWQIADVLVSASYGKGAPTCVLDQPGGLLTGTSTSVSLTSAGSCGEPVSGASVGQIEFTITTGTDDLRPDSEATAKLYFQDNSTQVVSLKKSNVDAFVSGSVNTVAADLLDSNPIQRIDISLIEHDSDVEGDDDWDVKEVLVVASYGGGPQVCIADGGGGTITGNNTVTIGPSNCAAGAPTNQPSVGNVELSITTGNDDLRIDSSASAMLVFHDGQTQTILLKSPTAAPWENGSVNVVETALFDATAIDRVVISLGENDEGLETDDEWNISSVIILAGVGTAPLACALERGGGGVDGNDDLILKSGGCLTAPRPGSSKARGPAKK